MTDAQVDSYEDYKRYLQESLGIPLVKAPAKPMSPYMRFFLERGYQERMKGDIHWMELSRILAQEWKNLDESKKKFYNQIYEIKMRERNQIMNMYRLITSRNKNKTAYLKFYEKRYPVYQKQLKGYTSKEISKKISEDWKNLSKKQKDKLTAECQAEKAINQEKYGSQEYLAKYQERVNDYEQSIKDQKEKLQKKYGYNKNWKQQERKRAKRQQKLKRIARIEAERSERRRIREQARRKQREDKIRRQKQAREEKRQKKQNEKEEKRKLQEKKKEEKKIKQEKVKQQKKKKQQGVKKQKSKSRSKSKPAKKVQKDVEQPKKKNKAPPKKAEKTKKKPKTKKIKKAPKKEAKGGKKAKKTTKTVVKKQETVKVEEKKVASKTRRRK